MRKADNHEDESDYINKLQRQGSAMEDEECVWSY